MSKKHKQQVKHTKVPADVKSSEERSGKSTLWALLVVIAGLTGSGILVQQTLAQEEAGAEAPKEAENDDNWGNASVADDASATANRKSEESSVEDYKLPCKVDVPKREKGKTFLAAIEEAIESANLKTEDTGFSYELKLVSTNSQDLLSQEYDWKHPVESIDLQQFLHVVPPSGASTWISAQEKDNTYRYVYVGTTQEINDLALAAAVEQLKNNHTVLTSQDVDFPPPGVPIAEAIQFICEAAGVNYTLNYMEEKDRSFAAPEETSQNPGASSMGPTNAVTSLRVVYTMTPGLGQEWRSVLHAVLRPKYDFDEFEGTVRIAKPEDFKRMHAEEVQSRPMALRYVPIVYADPYDIVEKLTVPPKHAGVSIFDGIKMNDRAILQVAPYQGGGTMATGARGQLSGTTSSLSTGSSGEQAGDTDTSSSGSAGDLLRPKNPPAILIYDAEENVDKLVEVVKSLDVREKQVLIEALILNLSDAGSRALGMKLDEMGFDSIPLLGVNWQKNHDAESGRMSYKNSELLETTASQSIYANGDGVFNGGTGFFHGDETNLDYDRDYKFGDYTVSRTTGDELTGSGRTRGRYAGRVGQRDEWRDNVRISERTRHLSSVLGPLDFKFILEMVETRGNGKVLSSPVLTIGDHSEAMIYVGNITPILNLDTQVNNGVTTTVTEDVDWMELMTGIHMWVGPEVTEKGNAVRLWVHPKITDTTGEWEVYQGSRYPHLETKELDTRVTVPSGGTLLLGGLTKIQKSEKLEKVPILGDIPFLGRLFRHHSTDSVRENLVILIRPTILDDENPETGFEAPANELIDPMMSESGRNLKDVLPMEDKMREREKKIIGAVKESVSGLVKKEEEEGVEVVSDETSETAETFEAAEE